MKWPPPFVRRKRATLPRPMSLADMLRESDRHDDADAVAKLAHDLKCSPAEVLALADETLADLRSGDDGSPSMLEGER